MTASISCGRSAVSIARVPSAIQVLRSVRRDHGLVYPVGTPLLYAVLLSQLRDVVADSGADKRSSQSIVGPLAAVRGRAGLLRSCRVRTPYIADGLVVVYLPRTMRPRARSRCSLLSFFSRCSKSSGRTPSESQTCVAFARGPRDRFPEHVRFRLLLKVDVNGERSQNQAAFAGVLVAGHVLIFRGVAAEL